MKKMSVLILSLLSFNVLAFENCPTGAQTFETVLKTVDIEIQVNEELFIKRGSPLSAGYFGGEHNVAVRAKNVDPTYDRIVTAGTKFVIRSVSPTEIWSLIPVSDEILSFKFAHFEANVRFLEDLSKLTSAEVIRCINRVRQIR